MNIIQSLKKQKLSTKIFIFISIFVALIVLVSSVVRIPVNIINEELLRDKSNSKIFLKSIDRQSIKFLPIPNLVIDKFKIQVQHPEIQFNAEINNFKGSRSLFNSENLFVNVENTKITDTKSKLPINNEILNGEINKLKIDILNTEESLKIKTNNFSYKGAKIKVEKDFTQQPLSLNKIKLHIKDLSFSLLKDLLSEKFSYIGIFNEIFQKGFVNGEITYENNLLSLQDLTLVFQNKGRILLSGTIDFNNFKNSNFDVQIVNVSLKDINKKTLTELFSHYSIYKDFEINDWMIENMDINFSSDGIVNNFTFKKLDTSSIVGETAYSWNEKSIKNLKLKIKNYEVTNNDINLLSSFVNDSRYINLIPKKLLIQNMSIDFQEDLLNINEIDLVDQNNNSQIRGGLIFNQKNYEGSSFNLKFENIPKILLSQIFSNFEILKPSTLDILLFDTFSLKANKNLDLKEIQLNEIQLFLKDEFETKGNLNINETNFEGTIDNLKIDIEKLDNLIIHTDRISGIANLYVEIPTTSYYDLKNIKGKLDGKIIIKAKENELALLSFLNNLIKDVEELTIANQLNERLINNFLNQEVLFQTNFYAESTENIEFKTGKLISSNDELIWKAKIHSKNYEIILEDVFPDGHLKIFYGESGFKAVRINREGKEIDPLEEILRKNANKLLQNLFQ